MLRAQPSLSGNDEALQLVYFAGDLLEQPSHLVGKGCVRATITLPLGLLALGSYLYLIGGRRGRVAPEVT